MIALCAAVLAATAAADEPAVQKAAASATPAPTKAVASQATLPPIAGGSQYGAPNSLPPVSGQLFHLGGMLEVQPLFAFSVGDPFWRTLGAGIRVEQHWDERWSISGHLIGGMSLVAPPVTVCGDGCSDPASGKLRSAPGQLQMLAGAELGWAPVYGKLSLFGEKTLHFDAYISLGPELVRELIAPDAASPETGRWALGGRVAIGERLFLTNRFMVRLAASELVYGSKVRGQGEIERKLTIEAGVAWLFGR